MTKLPVLYRQHEFVRTSEIADSIGIAQIVRKCRVCHLVRVSYLEGTGKRVTADWFRFGARIIAERAPSCCEPPLDVSGPPAAREAA